MKFKRLIKWAAGIILLVLVIWVFIAYWTSTNDCERYNHAAANPIKAIVKCEYGPPDALQLKDIEKPTPDDNQLLVRVHAAALNPLDGHELRGQLIVRLFGEGLRKPKESRVGVDYAGTVEAVGKNVTKFKPGDEVFGGRTGAFAQYVCVRADRAVALKPENVSFEQAGAVGVAGITALQGLRDKGHIQAGQKVLVNGASGGVGTFAVQIAKALGAQVTGVCSTRNVDLVKSIGADRVIDYTKDDFTKENERYDIIFDNVSNHSFSERRRLLTDNGICVMVGAGGAGAHEGFWSRLGGNMGAALRSKFTKQKFVMFIAQFNQKDIETLGDLMQSGKLNPVIDRDYKSLADIPEALRYLEQGHARGKVVVTVE